MKTDIKGIVLDVDGVIVGEKIGFNAPWPNTEVINALRLIKEKGIPVCLVTAKPHFAVQKIIESAKLNNPHITDGGSVLIDPIDNFIVKKYFLDKNLAQKALDLFIKNEIYTEFYTTDNYYIQKSQNSNVTEKHSQVLDRKPIMLESIVAESSKYDVTKIIVIAKNKEDIKRIEKTFTPLVGKLNLYWGVHPLVLPLQFGIIVPFGVSKAEGVREIIKSLGLSFENILGVGDSLSDWQFIQLCKFVATMGNANQELKDLVLSKGDKCSFVGPSVDENGILNIFGHFGL